MMLHINEVELYHEPRQKIADVFAEIPNEPEMSEDESAFLCGLLKKHRPRKIVEVGIAGGGTSAIILSCMKMLDLKESTLYSVDYAKRFYRDERYESGYLGKQARKVLELPAESHVVLTGDIACSFAEIADDIDFLIIDTMHVLPGELLDFITLLPALKEKTVIVLHDVALPFKEENHLAAIATDVLFASSVGEKYLNTFDFNDSYSNIAAIEVTEDTKKYIENVFSALLIPWKYMPDEKQLTGYRNIIKKHYPAELVALFDSAAALNGNMPPQCGGWLFPYAEVPVGSKIVLFGAGEVGTSFQKQLEHTEYCQIVKVVDNDKKKWTDGVCPPAEIAAIEYDFVVITIANQKIAAKITAQLHDMGVDAAKIIWCDYVLKD